MARSLIIVIMLTLILPAAALAENPEGATDRLKELGLPISGDELIRRSGRGDSYAVQLLLAAGIDANTRGRGRTTALIRASEKGYLEIAKALIEGGGDVNAAESSGLTPLIAAAKGGHAGIVKVLLEGGAEANATYKDSQTALMLAAQRGHPKIVKSLVANGAEVNMRAGNLGETPLFSATNRGHADIVRTLLSAGADPNSRNKQGWTPLHAAAWHGHTPIVKALLENGAVVDDKFRGGRMDGETSLMYAAKEGRADIVQVLLDNGADINTTDQMGSTCLTRATQRGHTEIAKMLLESGADADGRSLREAASAGRTEIARLFVESGVDINEEDRHGISALAYAATRGNTELVDFLLEHGANVNPTHAKGWAPLMGACKEGHTEIARILLDAGADPHLKSSEGTTALVYAEEGGHDGIVRMLTLTGANPAVSPLEARQRVRLATTTSTDNSGLLGVLLPPFENEFALKIDVIAVGTGRALKLGENGDVDLVLVHARAAEDEFVEKGFGVNRRDVMYNDFVLVGPESDPARLAECSSAADALGAIARSNAPFISRGDDSGTHKKELDLWRKIGIRPEGGWYIEAGQGMGAVLHIADEKRAYTLTDRGTWIAFSDKLDLEILFEGDKSLHDPYGIIAINPSVHPRANYNGAMLFIEWITSAVGQEVIADFEKNGQTLFFPSAEPVSPGSKSEQY